MDARIEEGGKRLVIAGDLTEEAEFAPMTAQLANGPAEVDVDLAGLKRINSSGVREWVNFARNLPAGRRLTLHRCPVSFVSQMNMIARFVGDARVESVFVPYLCGSCGAVKDELAQVPALKKGERGAAPCAKCGGAMELDADEVEYFAFLDKLP